MSVGPAEHSPSSDIPLSPEYTGETTLTRRKFFLQRMCLGVKAAITGNGILLAMSGFLKIIEAAAPKPEEDYQVPLPPPELEKQRVPSWSSLPEEHILFQKLTAEMLQKASLTPDVLSKMSESDRAEAIQKLQKRSPFLLQLPQITVEEKPYASEEAVVELYCGTDGPVLFVGRLGDKRSGRLFSFPDKLPRPLPPLKGIDFIHEAKKFVEKPDEKMKIRTGVELTPDASITALFPITQRIDESELSRIGAILLHTTQSSVQIAVDFMERSREGTEEEKQKKVTFELVQ